MATQIVWKGSTINNPILVGDISNIPTYVTTRGNTRTFTIIEYLPTTEIPDEIDITDQQFLEWRGNTREGILGKNAQSTPNIVNALESNSNINYIQPYKFIIEKAVLGVSQEQWDRIQSLQQQTIYFIGRPETVTVQPTIFGTIFTADITNNLPTGTPEQTEEVCSLQPQLNNLSRDSENPVQARLKGIFREQQLSTELTEGELKVKFQFPNGTVKYADILSFTDVAVQQCQNVLDEVKRDAESTLAEEIRTRGEIIRQSEIAVKELEDRLRETGAQFGLDLESARREFDARVDNLTRQNTRILNDKQKQFDQQINAKNITINSLQSTITQQIQQINNLGTRIQTVSSQLSASELARQGLAGQLSASEAARQGLAGQLSASEAARQGLAGQLSASEAARQGLAGQLSQSVAQRNNLNNQLNELNTIREGLANQLANANTTNLNLTGRISDLQDEAAILSETNRNLAAQAAISQQTINSLNANLQTERNKLNNIKNTIENSLENGNDQYISLIQQNLGSLSGLLGINFNTFAKASVGSGAAAGAAAAGSGLRNTGLFRA